MTDHAHPELATSREVNGFGGRLNTVQASQAEERTKTKRNEEDIQKIFGLVEQTAQSVQDVNVTMIRSVGAIDKKVGNLKWYMLGGIGAAGLVLKFLL